MSALHFFYSGAPEGMRNHHGVVMAVRKDRWNEWPIGNRIITAQIINSRENVLVNGVMHLQMSANIR